MSAYDYTIQNAPKGSDMRRHDHQIDNDNYISPEIHEKLYLSPENAVKGELRRTFGNPTPVGLAGLLLANTPACMDLLGWRGAGGGSGNVAAGIASFIFLGGMLLLLAGIGEWILGNTFPSVIFLTLSGYWITLGSTMIPSFAASSSYVDAGGNADSRGFQASVAYFSLWMGVLCLIYFICALRTNACLATILALFIVVFSFLAASNIYAAAGNDSRSARCGFIAGAFGFAASCVGWYLFVSLMFEAVDFPISLPVGDLSIHFKGGADRRRNAKARAQEV